MRSSRVGLDLHAGASSVMSALRLDGRTRAVDIVEAGDIIKGVERVLEADTAGESERRF